MSYMWNPQNQLLAPLFRLFAPVLCPDCNPEDPSLPPEPSDPSLTPLKSGQTFILDAAALGGVGGGEDLGTDGAGSTAVQKDAPTVADLVGKLDATGVKVEQNNVVPGNAVESLDVQQGGLAVAGVASTPGFDCRRYPLPVVRDQGGA